MATENSNDKYNLVILLIVAAVAIAGISSVSGLIGKKYINQGVIADYQSNENLVGQGGALNFVNCIDSDGGKVYYLKGTARSFTSNGDPYVYNDTCCVLTTYDGGTTTCYPTSESDNLIEEYCAYSQPSERKRYAYPIIYQCPFGCRDGACKAPPECLLLANQKTKTTQVYTVEGIDYEVKALYVRVNNSQLNINGETTSVLHEGSYYTLADGRQIEALSIPLGTISFCFLGKNQPAVAFLNLGGFTYKIVSSSDINFNDFSIMVDVNGDSIMGNFNLVVHGQEYDVLAKDSNFYLYGSSLLQYKGADKITNDNPVLKFKDLNTGNIIEQVYTNSSPLATIKVGGNEYGVYAASAITSNDFDIQIDMDASGLLGDYGITIIGNENLSALKENYILLNSYGVIQYLGADNKATQNPVMRFKDIQTGNTIELAYSIMY